MFNCSVCKETVGPNVRAVRVVLMTRAQQYHNEFYHEDEFGNRQLVKVDSQGHEIAKETLVCPACAQEPTYTSGHTIVVGGRSFQEKLAPPLRPLFVAFAVQGMLDRLEHDTKRAKQDTGFAVPNIKAYLDQPENAKLVF